MEREKNKCRAWYEGDPILEKYHDNEWCKVNHDDNFQFEMLCLEGASVGLSWKTILHKRANYRAAFHDFQIDACSEMTDEELENLMLDSGIIRNRSKIFSVRKNAQAVKKIHGHWKTVEQIPTVSDVSRKMALDMKKKGIAFVGPVITYSFLQSIGMVNDHLKDCKYRDH